jgi:NAD(P)-dependent dehydrogenase (short-subunit alcohol dehydrogenase family)
MSGRLAGKVCVITGTGGSMGRATSLLFAREGASVVGCDVTVEPAVASAVTAAQRRQHRSGFGRRRSPNTVLGFAILVGLGVVVSGWALLRRRQVRP